MSEQKTKMSFGRQYNTEGKASVLTILSLLNKILWPIGKIGGVIVGRLSSVSRYILACFLIMIAAFSSWILSIPRSAPDLLAPVFSTAWWLSPLERGAVLRLPIINTDTEPVAYTIKDERFYLSFKEIDSETLNFVYMDTDGNVFGTSTPNKKDTTGDKAIFQESRTIYFGYDSLELNRDANDQVDKIARLLKRFPDDLIVLEAHTGIHDNQTQEYSLALGERMAHSVRTALIERGIEEKRITTLSYGEELPVDEKDDKKNRRVEVFFEEEPLNKTQGNYHKDFEDSNTQIEWKVIPPSKTADEASSLIKIDQTWSLSKDKGIVLGSKDGQRWLPIGVTRIYAENYFKKKEPAFEFNFTVNKFQWRKKDRRIIGDWREVPHGSSVEWSESEFHRVYPAPLAYVIIGVVGFMVLIIVSAKVAPVAVSSDNIVEHFASDAPITKASSDCLGFDRIARSISQFLRNEKTTPPLTIAVTGQWGSGKSSLMQLLASDLKVHRIRPVWLNAWHHQNESQFLYGLLNAIRSQGIPSIFSGAHLLFRMRLLASRIKHEPFYALVLAALLAIPIGFLSAVEIGALPANWFTVWLTKGNWAVLGTTLPFFWGLFKLSGEKLTKLATSKFKQRLLSLTSSEIDLRSAAGLRDQFVQEFSHFCNGIGISTLTVFIDDLDRCGEKRVMDVLETVNFLVSSGKCIVVFGMDRDPVERAVANYYSASYKNAKEGELINFARRYLEKLVNIEVPVPVAKDEKTVDLVAPKSQDKFSSIRLLKATISILLLTVFSLFFFYLGIQFGELVSKKEPESKKVLELEEVNKPKNVAETFNTTRSPPVDEVNIIKEHESNKATFPYTFGPVIFLFVLAGFLTMENHRQRSRVLVSDSEDFTHAIQGWILLMGYRNSTPRRIKRFVNRARFLTMRLRNDRESGITENDLVTMAGMHELNPDLLGLIEKGEKDAITEEVDRLIPDNNIETIKKSIRQFNSLNNKNIISVFKSWVQGFDVR